MCSKNGEYLIQYLFKFNDKIPVESQWNLLFVRKVVKDFGFPSIDVHTMQTVEIVSDPSSPGAQPISIFETSNS